MIFPLKYPSIPIKHTLKHHNRPWIHGVKHPRWFFRGTSTTGTPGIVAPKGMANWRWADAYGDNLG